MANVSGISLHQGRKPSNRRFPGVSFGECLKDFATFGLEISNRRFPGVSRYGDRDKDIDQILEVSRCELLGVRLNA